MKLKEVSKVVEGWQKILRLEAWRVYLKIGFPSNTGSIAEIVTDYTYRVAEMTVSPDAKKDEIDEIVCHELLHVLVGEVRNNANFFKDRITANEKKRIIMSEEAVVDELTRIINELYDELERSDAKC